MRSLSSNQAHQALPHGHTTRISSQSALPSSPSQERGSRRIVHEGSTGFVEFCKGGDEEEGASRTRTCTIQMEASTATALFPKHCTSAFLPVAPSRFHIPLTPILSPRKRLPPPPPPWPQDSSNGDVQGVQAFKLLGPRLSKNPRAAPSQSLSSTHPTTRKTPQTR